jgi:phosphatidylglycerophosphatase A
MNDKIARLLGTWFYVGDCPVASGTAGSFAGLLLAVALQPFMIVYILATLLIIVVGIPAATIVEKQVGTKDPGIVVIDEVAGILLSLFLLPLRIDVLIVAFFLFRAFDMFKIYPSNEFEKFEGGIGIMMDDVVAGIYTNLIMQAAIRLAGIH